MREISRETWLAELKDIAERFNEGEVLDVRFVCPSCGESGSMREFQSAGQDPQGAYQECVQRMNRNTTYSTAEQDERGPAACDWTAYGLLGTLGKGRLVKDDRQSKPLEVFEFEAVVAGREHGIDVVTA